MKIKLILLVVVGLLLANFQNIANAGGPLVVKDGIPVVYNGPLVYRFDQGPLGKFSNSEARALIEDLLNDWEAVNTATITFQRDNPDSLDADIDENNFGPVLTGNSLLGFTAIVFDADGGLLDAFLGAGARNQVLGLAGPITLNSGPLSGQIAESQAIFNGRFIDGVNSASNPESDDDTFKGTIIHEFGHAFGLDHTQINVEAIQSGASNSIRESVPLMFPIAVNSLFEIKRDDQSAVALLYPENNALNSFGSIEGKVLRSNGSTPVQGANVIARRIDDSQNEAVSCVSDFLLQNNGEYRLFGLTPGQYRIEIEPIDLNFTGGSGVGPFSASKTDQSFQNPVPEGFFAGPNQPITTVENEALVINVSAGQKITGQDIIASTQVTTSSTSSSTGGTTNENEPNNTVGTAQVVTPPITINGAASSTDTGEIELGSDTGAMVVISDLFKFTLGNDSNLNALLTIDSTNSTDDLDLVLLDEFATEILDSSSQTGNDDELITGLLEAGTYLIGVGAFEGSSSYSLELTTITEAGTPFISIAGPESIVLNPSGKKNRVKLEVTGFNITNRTKCSISNTGNAQVRTKPRNLKLTKNKSKRRIKVRVPKSESLSLIQNNQEATTTIQVQCDNGATDEFSIDILPNTDSLERNRLYRHVIKK